MSKFLKLNLTILSISILLFIGSFSDSLVSKVRAYITSTNLTGYAWSDKVGWISFSSENVVPAVCGNNIKETGEICDGSVPSGITCATELGASYNGTLSCNNTCSGFITSSCSSCVPTSETRAGAPCVGGRTGLITEKRNYTCSGDIGTWSAWSIISNTCAPIVIERVSTYSNTQVVSVSCLTGETRTTGWCSATNGACTIKPVMNVPTTNGWSCNDQVGGASNNYCGVVAHANCSI